MDNMQPMSPPTVKCSSSFGISLKHCGIRLFPECAVCDLNILHNRLDVPKTWYYVKSALPVAENVLYLFCPLAALHFKQ